MGFFNAVGQVITNQKNFKQWEKEDANRQKQREALSKNGIDPIELDKAARKGKVIMDVIDIMDTHSEEVAENTETAVMPIAQTFPSLVSFIAILGATKFYLMPKSNAYDKAMADFVKSDAGKETRQIVEQLQNYAKQESSNSTLNKIKLAETDFMTGLIGKRLKDVDNLDSKKYSVTTIFNKKNMGILSSSNNENVKNLHSRLSELSKEFKNTKGIKNYSLGKTLGKTALLTGGVSAVAFIAANIIAAKIQVKSSRIARWQSREDLSDPKYFVQYTDEQINKAKQNIKPDEDKQKGFSLFKKKKEKEGQLKYSDNNSFFKSLGTIIQDNKQYDEWKSNYNLEDKKVKRNLSEKEIEEAQKEQEVIQRITKIINNNAEEYSENMETAAGLLIGGTPFLGLGIGALINTFMTKSGIGEKISNNRFNKLIKTIPDDAKKEEIKKLYQNLKPTKDKECTGFVAKLSKKFGDMKNVGTYYEKMMEALFSAQKLDTKGAMGEQLGAIKNLASITSTMKTGRNIMVATVGSLITGTVGAFIGLKLQKSAARAGRFKAKRELEQNSENFIGYTKNDFNTVSDIKAEKKPALQKLGEYLTFIPRVIKDYYNYENYRKNEADYDKKLLHELTKVEVTDKQMQEAEELQRKLFTTFESVDDKSQEYSEAIEAVTEMVQPQLPYIGLFIVSLPLIIGGAKLAKGGTPKAAESITGFFAKHTGFLKGKTASKYINGVSENIKGVVEKQNIDASSSYAKILELLSGTEDGAKITTAVQDALKSAKGADNELRAFLKALADDPVFKNQNQKSISKEEVFKAIDDYKDTIDSYTRMINKFMGTNSNENIDLNIKDMFDSSHIDGITSLSDLLNRASEMEDLPNVKVTDINSILDSFNKQLGEFKNDFKGTLNSNGATGIINSSLEDKIKSGEWREALSKMEEDMPEGILKSTIGNLVDSSMTDKQALKIYQNINTILKNIPKEELEKVMDTAIEEFTKNPAKFIKALQTGQLKTVFLTKGIALTAIASPIVWNALGTLITFTIISTCASMQKQAGRLGVMKALEELEDYKFYANMNPEIQENNTSFASKTNSFAQSNTNNTAIDNNIFNRFMQNL